MTICLDEIDSEMIKYAIKSGYKPNCKKDRMYISGLCSENRRHNN